MSVRVWHAPEPAPASGAARRPEHTPQKVFPKAPEPDKALENKRVRVYLAGGEVLTGLLCRVSTYMLLLRTPEGARAIYKHAIQSLVEEPCEAGIGRTKAADR